MSQHSDEAVAHDPLLAFSTEPGGKPSESTESLTARVDQLDRALGASAGQIALLKSEVATLVGAIDDIKKRELQPPAVARMPRLPISARSRTTAAVLGMLAGITIGLMGWMLWSRNSIDVIAPKAAPAAVEAPAETAAAPEAVATASITPAPRRARDVPARAVAESYADPVEYVGTLSIDAAPGGRVFIDRKPAGSAPLRVANLKAGSHLVWIEREGYRRWTRVVEVRSDRVSRVSAELEPLAVR